MASHTKVHTGRIETDMMSLSISANPTTEFSRPEAYIDTPSRMIWNSLVKLLCAIAEHVTVRAERFEEILDILDPALESKNVCQALECSNADAVWLRLYKKSRRDESDKQPLTLVSGTGTAAQAEKIFGKVPVGKPHWQFVRI